MSPTYSLIDEENSKSTCEGTQVHEFVHPFAWASVSLMSAEKSQL